MAETIKVDTDVRHSILGASSAKRWMNCTGSVKLIKSLPPGERRATSHAALGTAAHALLAHCLLNDQDSWEHAGKEIEADGWKFTVDEEMVESVQEAIDFVRKKMDQFAHLNPVLHVERPMESFLDDEAFGTGDIIIEVPDDRIIVMDYKHGLGICVEPTEPQPKYYGYLGVENATVPGLDSKVIELYIIQPRLPHPKGPIRRHVTNAAELTDYFHNELLPAMERTRGDDTVLAIGEWCRFCPARNACPALRKQASDFDGNAVAAPEVLSGDEIGDLIVKLDQIEKYLSGLKAEAYKRAMAGEAVKHFKLVRQKANRTWKAGGEEAIRAAFGDAALTEPKLKGPAQIEKLEGGKTLVSRWAYTPDKGLTLAPLSDKRDAVKPHLETYMDQVDAAVELDDAA